MKHVTVIGKPEKGVVYLSDFLVNGPVSRLCSLL